MRNELYTKENCIEFDDGYASIETNINTIEFKANPQCQLNTYYISFKFKINEQVEKMFDFMIEKLKELPDNLEEEEDEEEDDE